MSEPFSFVPADRYEIKGRGSVFTGPCPFDLASTKDLIGREVAIEGQTFTVCGVEWWAIERPPRKGEGIGLLVVPL